MDRFDIETGELPVLICRGQPVLRNPADQQVADCLGFNAEVDPEKNQPGYFRSRKTARFDPMSNIFAPALLPDTWSMATSPQGSPNSLFVLLATSFSFPASFLRSDLKTLFSGSTPGLSLRIWLDRNSRLLLASIPDSPG
jgi:hypothetical protein